MATELLACMADKAAAPMVTSEAAMALRGLGRNYPSALTRQWPQLLAAARTLGLGVRMDCIALMDTCLACLLCVLP